MSREFKFSGEYFKEVADTGCESAKWDAIWICLSKEISNDVTFLNAETNSLTVDLSGTRRHLSILDGKTDERRTNVGDICQIPKGASARFAWDTLEDEQRSIMLEFTDNLFTIYCPEIISGIFLNGHLTPQNYSAKDGLLLLLRLLSRELHCHTKRGQLFAESVIRLLAIEIAVSAWTHKPSLLCPLASTDRRIRKAVDYIEANFSFNISLQDLTREAGLNATHLISLFKRVTGRTPYAYVISRRIQEAIHLLRKNHMPISEIALEVGFSDQQQMTHAFQRHFKRTPKSFKPGCESQTLA